MPIPILAGYFIIPCLTLLQITLPAVVRLTCNGYFGQGLLSKPFCIMIA